MGFSLCLIIQLFIIYTHNASLRGKK
jgi:hypothetical protein